MSFKQTSSHYGIAVLTHRGRESSLHFDREKITVTNNVIPFIFACNKSCNISLSWNLTFVFIVKLVHNRERKAHAEKNFFLKSLDPLINFNL